MGIISNSYIPKEIKACLEDDTFFSRGVTIVSGQAGVLAEGTVLGKITSSGKYGPYSDASGTAGLEKAVAILAERVDATGSSDVNAKAFFTGKFQSSQLTGLDAGAKVDLGARTLPDGTLFIEGSDN